MAQHLRDLGDGRAVPDHAGGQAVSEQVRHAPRPGAHARARERETNNVIDRAGARQSNAWRDHAQKDAPRQTGPTVLTKIARDGLPDVSEEWHMIDSWPLAADDDLAGAPAKVPELERHDFARAQTQAGEQEQDGHITATSRCPYIRRRSYSLHLLERQPSRHPRLAIRADHRDGRG